MKTTAPPDLDDQDIWLTTIHEADARNLLFQGLALAPSAREGFMKLPALRTLVEDGEVNSF